MLGYKDKRDQNTDAVDRSVMALIDCANCYLNEPEVLTLLVTSLMKLTEVDMTTKHSEIKEFMLKIESNNDFFIHKIASGILYIDLEFICNAKYGKALAYSN